MKTSSAPERLSDPTSLIILSLITPSLVPLLTSFRSSAAKGAGVLLLGTSLLAATAAGADPTISDKAMAQKLLGNHALTLQWLGSGTLRDAGKAEVKAENGTWHLTGRQDAKEGHVSLDGIVTAIDATSFAFTGKIITNVSYINQGKDCLRDGTFTFAKKGTRKYWRMQQIDNPCDDAADYVDIYFR